MRCEAAPKLHLDDGFDLRPATAADAGKIAWWMAQPHIQRWWQQDWSVERWAQALDAQAAGEHSIPCLAALEDEDFGYLELYRVRRDRLAEFYACAEHDWGVHVAIGDTARVGRGIGRRLLRSVADALLRADPRCDRVVAEPDVRNTPSIRAFAAAGFDPAGELQLPEKTALLMVRTRTVEA
ncbi:GCN5-related N-acetyltransferase [Kribbella flavida DSM 17836]|uniref:Lysine N-acyltransferase MbtK n=1 Tax=Kribbella flavida (strain DSM 17836 / JCM 10339 / NBRC 14399) TaxID=479435 RepID=D2Q4D2_KRIFD|nr:GNAT family N-acetyltransferase [Kribbella flavida]ADB32246.1 GCN5-related N-acetyltransferase [Kribbella flavida DSM 17836]